MISWKLSHKHISWKAFSALLALFLDIMNSWPIIIIYSFALHSSTRVVKTFPVKSLSIFHHENHHKRSKLMQKSIVKFTLKYLSHWQVNPNKPPTRPRKSELVWAFGTWRQIHRQMSRLWQTTDKTTRTLVLAIIKRLLSTTPLSSSDLSDMCNIIVPVNFSFALPLWSRSSSLHSLESLRTSNCWLWYFM